MNTVAHKRSMKTLLIAGVAIAAVGISAVGYYLLSPNGYLSLDVNPSIEIRTNRLERVTSVAGANEDGKALLEGYRLTDRDLDDVIEDLVDRMVLQGYLKNDTDNDVLVTVDDDTVSPETLERVNRTIETYVSQRELEANVMSQTVDVNDELLAEAAKYHVSAGKMTVIDRLAAGDASLTPGELADTRVSDLIAYASEKNISLDLLEERLDDLEDQYAVSYTHLGVA